MSASERREWRNYWVTRRGLAGSWKASLQAARAVAVWARRRWGRPAVVPDYLSAAEIRAACEPWAPPAGPPAPSRVPPADVPKSLREWAEGYEDRFRRFLGGSLQRSADPEDYWTLHQFGWLLALVLAGDAVSAEQAREYAGRWIASLGGAVEDPAWRTFSISERLSNWTHIFQLVDPGPLWPALCENMRAQAIHLAGRLEGQVEGGGANNHLINNGRGLYLAGRVLGLEGLTRIGRTILLREAERQITRDGFLDEGSSHYQLIVTKDYLEALAAARASGDAEMEVLAPRLAAMLRACAFFRDDLVEEWPIPFIGDISPDPPPGFFGTATRFWDLARRASSRAGLVVDTSVPWFAARDGADGAPGPTAPGWLSYPDSGYYRWNGARYVAWSHARRRGAPRRHAHNDWGSFEVHVGGEPIVIDPGRESYRDRETGYDCRLTLAQNAVAVDGFEQAVYLKRDLFVPEYLDGGADVECQGGGEAGRLSIRIRGYERLQEPVVHTRTFFLDRDGMTVADAFAGRGEHTLTAAFHLHPDVQCAADGDCAFRLATQHGKRIRLALTPGGALSLKRGGSPATPGGYCSTEYGTRRETTTIFAEYRQALPLTLEHRILL